MTVESSAARPQPRERQPVAPIVVEEEDDYLPEEDFEAEDTGDTEDTEDRAERDEEGEGEASRRRRRRRRRGGRGRRRDTENGEEAATPICRRAA